MSSAIVFDYDNAENAINGTDSFKLSSNFKLQPHNNNSKPQRGVKSRRSLSSSSNKRKRVGSSSKGRRISCKRQELNLHTGVNNNKAAMQSYSASVNQQEDWPMISSETHQHKGHEAAPYTKSASYPQKNAASMQHLISKQSSLIGGLSPDSPSTGGYDLNVHPGTNFINNAYQEVDGESSQKSLNRRATSVKRDSVGRKGSSESRKNQSSKKRQTGQLGGIKKQSSLKKFDSKLYQQSQMSYTKVFVMGDTQHGQLGFQDPNKSSHDEALRHSQIISVPKMCSYNILIKAIACGEAHTHLLSQDGYVYSMGSNQFGVLGLGQGDDELKSVTQPQLVPNLQCIIEIASGRAHSIALDVRREVYGWGRSDNGAIGLHMATPQNQSQPLPLNLNLDTKDQVIQVDCGLEHSCFLTTDGHCFGCGEGEYGQLGLGYSTMKEYRPMRAKFKSLPPGDYVTKVACGAHHTVYLTRQKQVWCTGANNLGQLGIDSLESQVNQPCLVESLNGKSVDQIACGESSFAITEQGDLYVWGLYNLTVYRKPFMPETAQGVIGCVSQSFYGVTAAIDAEGQAWYWFSQLSAEATNSMSLSPFPSVLKQMKKRQVQKVFAGKDLVFALGEDINGSGSGVGVGVSQASKSSLLRDSQASLSVTAQSQAHQMRGHDSMKDADSTPAVNSNSAIAHMPMLNLTKIHEGIESPDQSKNDISHPKGFSRQERVFETVPMKQKRRSRTPSRASRSRSRSAQKPAKKTAPTVVSSTNQPNNRAISSPEHRRGRSPKKPRERRVRATHATSKSRSRDKSRPMSQPLSCRRGQTRSKSRSESKNKRAAVLKKRTTATSNRQVLTTKQSLKSLSKTSTSQVRIRKSDLEKKVTQKFEDLSQRLLCDKNEVVTRLAQLTQKVHKMQKQQQKSATTLSSKPSFVQSPPSSVAPVAHQKRVVGKKQEISVAEPFSDLKLGSFDQQSEPEEGFSGRQGQSNIVIADQRAQLESQTYEDQTRQNLNMFNQELQDEINTISRPQLIYSPNQGTVDIRSPHRDSQQPANPTCSQPLPVAQTRDSPPSKDVQPQHLNTDLTNGPSRAIPLPVARSQSTAARVMNTYQGPPPGYNNVRSPKQHSVVGRSHIKSPISQTSSAKAGKKVHDRPQSFAALNNSSAYDKQLINQLRQQIEHLESQASHLRDDKQKEAIRANEYQSRYEDAKKSALSTDLQQESLVRSLESQLRTTKLEKSDIAIRHADAERRVRDLEAKVIELAASKSKEQDYLDKLGKSHETLRAEKAKNKEVQAQNEMLRSTIGILETTIGQVKHDKEIIEHEYTKMKEYLQAKELEVKAREYGDMVERQSESPGRNTADEMERRSKSLGVRSSSQKPEEQSALRTRRPSSSLLDKRLPRSTERKPRPVSGLAQSTPAETDFLNQSAGIPQGYNPEGIVLGSGLAEDYQPIEEEPISHDAVARDQHYNIPTPPQENQFTARPIQQSVNPVQEHANQPLRTMDFRPREPSSTAIDQPVFTENRPETEAPRIARLLEDAKLIQEKHAELMGTSPLRVKDARSDSQPRSQSGASAIRDAAERAKQQTYQHLMSGKDNNSASRQPLNQSQSPSAYSRMDKTPLRHRSQPHFPSGTQPPVRDTQDSMIRPFCQPPSQSDIEPSQPSRSTPYAPPNPFVPPTPETTSYQPHHGLPEEGQRLASIKQWTEPSWPTPPVYQDPSAEQIRANAGIKPRPRSPISDISDPEQKIQPQIGNFKDLVREAQKARIPQKAVRSRPARVEDEPRPREPSRKHSNQDYIDNQINREMPHDRQPLDTKSLLDPKDREDLYNQKLLDNIERLAQKAKAKQRQPRDDSLSVSPVRDRSPNHRPVSFAKRVDTALPSSIFPQAAQAEPKGRVPSNQSRGRRRPLSKDEENQETADMVNGKPKPRAGWNNGGFTDQNKEPEQQTAQNNSFLARREALQNRLKKL